MYAESTTHNSNGMRTGVVIHVTLSRVPVSVCLCFGVSQLRCVPLANYFEHLFGVIVQFCRRRLCDCSLHMNLNASLFFGFTRKRLLGLLAEMESLTSVKDLTGSDLWKTSEKTDPLINSDYKLSYLVNEQISEF